MKKVLFITGTRADYGKLKAIIQEVEKSNHFQTHIYVSGMHLLENYGSTYNEVLNDGYQNVYIAYGLNVTKDMSYNLGDLVCNLTGYVKNIRPDMIIVHGDRIDALAGAMVGALNNIMVAHFEGGEVSGTIDESIRHAISKFAHLHFVSTEKAKQRLIQLGEISDDVHVIGSPDIDIMVSSVLPSINAAKEHYEIPYDKYGILVYHSVTTEIEELAENIKAVITAAEESKQNFVVIYPNNDTGSDAIINELSRLEGNPRFRIFPSLRFEYFLTFLKHADFMMGNSSAGIRETCIYGVPSINIGTRQSGRFDSNVLKNIISCNENVSEILDCLNRIDSCRWKTVHFGNGDSCKKFIEVISKEVVWGRTLQKKFIDIED